MRARKVCHGPFSNITFWKSIGPQILTDVKSIKKKMTCVNDISEGKHSVFNRLIIISDPPSPVLQVISNLKNGIFLSLDLWWMCIITPMSDISLRLCWLLSMTLELIMVGMGFIKAPRCTEDGVCLSAWARLSCRMAEGVKAQEEANLHACLGAGKTAWRMAAIARVSSDSANLMCCRQGLLIPSS